MIYCIDSNIIIWGIKEQASPGQEEMIPRAKRLFKKFDEYQDYIIIPTVVLSEVLAPELPEIRAKYLEILSASFIIAPFDERAAMKYAEILHARMTEVKELAIANDIPRQKMKVDHLVIATAIVNNANSIYTTDPGLKTFAQELIDVKDLPPMLEPSPHGRGQQQDLFGNVKTIQDVKVKQQNEDQDDPF